MCSMHPCPLQGGCSSGPAHSARVTFICWERLCSRSGRQASGTPVDPRCEVQESETISSMVAIHPGPARASLKAQGCLQQQHADG